MLHTINQSEFNALAAQGFNRIPLVVETFADLDTPLSLYLKLANQPYSYLLESVQGGERFGRYSIIGLPAKTRVVAHGRNVEVLKNNEVVESFQDTNPLDFVQNYQSRFKVPPYQGLPRFTGGLAGYFGYETVRYIERRLADTVKADHINVPDVLLMVSEELAVVDNLSGKLYFIVYANPEEANAYNNARTRLADLIKRLRQSVAIPESHPMPANEAVSEFGEANFKAAVEKAGSFDVDKVVAASPGIELKTAPEGYVKLHENHHLWSKTRIGQIQKNGQFKVVYESDLIEPNPFPKGYQ